MLTIGQEVCDYEKEVFNFDEKYYMCDYYGYKDVYHEYGNCTRCY